MCVREKVMEIHMLPMHQDSTLYSRQAMQRNRRTDATAPCSHHNNDRMTLSTAINCL